MVDLTQNSLIECKIPGSPKSTSLVDSGSSKCLIAARTIRESDYLSSCGIRILEKAISFTIGNGSKMYCNRVIDFELIIQGSKISITAFIIPNLGGYHLILGMDFLLSTEAILDFRHNVFRLKKQKIQVKPIRKYRIAPNSQSYVTVKANLPSAIKSKDLILSSTPHFQKIAPSFCLVQIRKGNAMLKVSNVTDKPINLSKHLSVGYINTNDLGLVFCEPDDEITNQYLGSIKVDSNIKECKHSNPPDARIDREALKQQKSQLYPFLDPDDPKLSMTNTEVLEKEIHLENSRLSSRGKAELKKILVKHSDAFALHSEVGTCTDSNIKFELKENDGLFIRPYVTSTADKEVMLKEVEKLVKMGILKKARTSYLSPLLLVRHPVTRKPRVVTDFRKLNELIKKEHVPVPMARDAVDAIGRSEAKFITILDIKAAYHSLLLAHECQDYTGVCPFPGGPTYKYSRVPMGLRISGSQFNQYMENIMDRDLPNWRDFLFIIQDDMAIHSKTEQQHIRDIEKVLKVIKNHGLKLAADKAQIALPSITYMGFIITYDKNGNPVMKAEKKKSEAIQKFPQPKTVKDVRSLAGMVNYLAKFLPKLQDIMKPIYHLTKKSAKFEWGPEQQKSFELLKHYLQKAPVLSMPTPTGEFVVYSDTSKVATGASLWQVQNGEEKLIAYHSKSLPPSAARWSISELELTGLYYNLIGFKHALKGTYFQAKVDHSALTYIWKARTEPPTQRLKKILEKLQDFDFDLSYEKGINLKIADALSRNPAVDDIPGTPIAPIAFADVAKRMLGREAMEMTREMSVEDSMDIPYRAVNTSLVVTRSGSKNSQGSLTPAGDFGTRRTRSSTTKSSPQTIEPPVQVKVSEPKRSRLPPSRLEYDTPGGMPSRRPEPKVQSQGQIDKNIRDFITRAQSEISRVPTSFESNISRPAVVEHENTHIVPTNVPNTFIENEGYKYKGHRQIPSDIINRERVLNDADMDILPEFEEIYVPDSVDNRPKAIAPLFSNVQNIKYKFPKQREIDPLLKIIKDRAISDFNINVDQQKLKLEQRKDQTYRDIIRYLSCDMLPTDKKSAKAVIHRSEDYTLVDDILFRVPTQQKEGTPERIQLCVPDSLITSILDCHHTSILGGHQGVTRTCEELRRKYYFKNMLSRVNEYIASCSLCQEHRDPVKKLFPMKRRLHPDWAPFKYLSIDVKTMYPSKTGYKGILVCVCECSHYMEAFPLRTGTAVEVAEILTQNIFLKHGIPTQIAFDCARNFQNELIDHILKAMNIRVKFINPAAHHSHKVERYIYTLQEYLIRQLRGNGDLWDLYLNAAVSCHNKTATPSLAGYSPYYIRYLQHPPNMDKLDIPPISHARPNVEQYVELLRKRQQFIKESMVKLRETDQEKQRIITSQKANIKEFEVGDIVYLSSPTHSELVTSSKKICLKWVGPYIIYNMLNSTNVILQTLDCNIISTVVSTHRLKHASIKTKDGKILRTKREIVESLDNRTNDETTLLKDRLTMEDKNLESQPNETLFSSSQFKSNLMIIEEGFEILPPLENHQTGYHNIKEARFQNGELQVLTTSTDHPVKHNSWIDLHDNHHGINIALKILNQEIPIPVKGTPAGKPRVLKKSKPKQTKPKKLIIESCPDLLWDDNLLCSELL